MMPFDRQKLIVMQLPGQSSADLSNVYNLIDAEMITFCKTCVFGWYNGNGQKNKLSVLKTGTDITQDMLSCTEQKQSTLDLVCLSRKAVIFLRSF